MAYLCEKSVGPTKSCDFRSGKMILQQEISKAEMQKLLAEGKTTLLRGFVSNRTKRKFSAFLVRGKDGKVGFEFEERKAAPKAAAKALSATSEEAVAVTTATNAAAAAKPAKSATGKTAKTTAKSASKTSAKAAIKKK